MVALTESDIERLQAEYFYEWQNQRSPTEQVIVDILTEKGTLNLQELSRDDALVGIPLGEELYAKRHPIYGLSTVVRGDRGIIAYSPSN